MYSKLVSSLFSRSHSSKVAAGGKGDRGADLQKGPLLGKEEEKSDPGAPPTSIPVDPLFPLSFPPGSAPSEASYPEQSSLQMRAVALTWEVMVGA